MALEHSPQGLQDRNQVMEHLVFGRKYLSVVNFSKKLTSTWLLVFWLVCRQTLCLPPQLISYSRQVSFRSSRGSKKTSNSWGSILLLSRNSSCSVSGRLPRELMLLRWLLPAVCRTLFPQVCPQPPAGTRADSFLSVSSNLRSVLCEVS